MNYQLSCAWLWRTRATSNALILRFINNLLMYRGLKHSIVITNGSRLPLRRQVMTKDRRRPVSSQGCFRTRKKWRILIQSLMHVHINTSYKNVLYVLLRLCSSIRQLVFQQRVLQNKNEMKTRRVSCQRCVETKWWQTLAGDTVFTRACDVHTVTDSLGTGYFVQIHKETNYVSWDLQLHVYSNGRDDLPSGGGQPWCALLAQYCGGTVESCVTRGWHVYARASRYGRKPSACCISFLIRSCSLQYAQLRSTWIVTWRIKPGANHKRRTLTTVSTPLQHIS